MTHRYGTDRRQGFVVEETFEPKEGHVIRTYWYGPRHGFGTTFGGLGYSVAVFPSRPAARAAVERSPLAGGWRPGMRARRVADVERELEAAGYTFTTADAQWRRTA